MKEKTKNTLKRIGKFIIVPPSSCESIIQWAWRNIMLPDAKGRPSWTYTLSFIIILIFGLASKIEFTVATSMIKVIDPNTGKVISEQMKGVEMGYWSALIVLLGALVFFIKFKVAGKQISDSDTDLNPQPSTPAGPVAGPTVPASQAGGIVNTIIGGITGK